ncbi:MAG: PEGA domain-containing protein [Deltaproteobacteria bacterium]|nr:PEGA domain-containing protein [Deltaproteobacteria bacterium]
MKAARCIGLSVAALCLTRAASAEDAARPRNVLEIPAPARRRSVHVPRSAKDWPVGTTAVRPGDVAVVRLVATGPVLEADLAAASDAVAAELRLSYSEVLLPADAAAGIERAQPGCLTAPGARCLGRALEDMGWPMFVSGRVTRSGASTEVTLELFESRTGRSLARASRETTAADRAGLVALGRVLVRDLARGVEAGRRVAHLAVDSDPEAATVTVNGRMVGRTPWAGDLEPGRATLVVELSGRVRQSRDLDLAAGESERVVLTLPGSTAAARRRPLVGPLLLGVAGLGLIVLDAVTLAARGCTGTGAAGTCARIAPVPFAVYGLGGVAAVGGAFLWYFFGGQPDAAEVSAR